MAFSVGLHVPTIAKTQPDIHHSTRPGSPEAVAAGNVVEMPGMIDMRRLIARALAPAIEGVAVVKDKGGKPSPALTLEALACEALGWEQLARESGAMVSADGVLKAAAAALGLPFEWPELRNTLTVERQVPQQAKKAGRQVALNRLRREARKAITTAKPDDGPKKLKGSALIDFVREKFDVESDAWGGHISVNGEVLKKVEHLYLKLADEHNVEAGKEAAIDTIAYVAEQNKKDRVLDDFDSLAGTEPLNDDDWENIAEFCLGTAEPFDNMALRKGLIAAVARAKSPGCKVDECPILQGPQGLRKSTFLAVLAGDGNFNDRLSDFDNKDIYQELHSAWFHEQGEFDRFTSKTDAADVKSFVSKSFDTFRAPYAKSPETFLRRCVIWGSVNPPIFLVDNTGNRRFPIIKVRQVIDIDKLKEFRGRIWARAIAAYESGESWHYSTEETKLINERAQEFMYEDSWEPDVASYLDGRDEVTLNDVLKSIGFETGKIGGKETSRVAKILIGLGWEKGPRRRIQGGLRYPWYPPQGADSGVAAEITPSAEPPEKLATEVEVTAEDEPLKDFEVQGLADVLITAVKMGGLDAVENFEQLPEPHKRQIWVAIPSAEKEIVRAAIATLTKADSDNSESEANPVN